MMPVLTKIADLEAFEVQGIRSYSRSLESHARKQFIGSLSRPRKKKVDPGVGICLSDTL